LQELKGPGKNRKETMKWEGEPGDQVVGGGGATVRTTEALGVEENNRSQRPGKATAAKA